MPIIGSTIILQTGNLAPGEYRVTVAVGKTNEEPVSERRTVGVVERK